MRPATKQAVRSRESRKPIDPTSELIRGGAEIITQVPRWSTTSPATVGAKSVPSERNVCTSHDPSSNYVWKIQARARLNVVNSRLALDAYRASASIYLWD